MKVGNCWANIDKKEGSLNSKANIYFDEMILVPTEVSR